MLKKDKNHFLFASSLSPQAATLRRVEELGTENERLRAQLEKVRPPAPRKAGPRSGAPAS